MMARDIRWATDSVRFAIEALGFTPDAWQTKCLRSTARRLLLNCTRQGGKSTTTAVVALHRALFFPKSLILLFSPSLRQSGELFRKIVDFLTRLDADTQPALDEDNRTSVVFANGSRIVSLPGSDRTVRGFSGPVLVIEDESARVDDELYMAVRPMLATSGGRMILLSTPFGKRGHFHHEWTEGGDAWERILVPATECPRISAEFLEQERASIGQWWYRQEYSCEFLETVDQVFSFDSIQAAVTDQVQPLFQAVQ